MAYLTRSELSSVAQSKAGYSGIKSVVNDSRSAFKASQSTSLFLSHSHLDKDAVESAVVFFRKLGINIYVDWMDETMSSKPDATTAEKIKIRIKDNDKFILLATNAAVNSKWCNWETGIGDMNKFISKKIAVFPIADNSGTWNGNEYLQLYPRIENINNVFVVISPTGSSEHLVTWLIR